MTSRPKNPPYLCDKCKRILRSRGPRIYEGITGEPQVQKAPPKPFPLWAKILIGIVAVIVFVGIVWAARRWWKMRHSGDPYPPAADEHVAAYQHTRFERQQIAINKSLSGDLRDLIRQKSMEDKDVQTIAEEVLMADKGMQTMQVIDEEEKREEEPIKDKENETEITKKYFPGFGWLPIIRSTNPIDLKTQTTWLGPNVVLRFKNNPDRYYNTIRTMGPDDQAEIYGNHPTRVDSQGNPIMHRILDADRKYHLTTADWDEQVDLELISEQQVQADEERMVEKKAQGKKIQQQGYQPTLAEGLLQAFDQDFI